MIHTGSRGLGHQVCTDALAACDRCGAQGATSAGAGGGRRRWHAPPSLPVCSRAPCSAPPCRAMARAKVKLVDRQLACMPIGSPEGQAYLGAMQAAANFAFCNRLLSGCLPACPALPDFWPAWVRSRRSCQLALERCRVGLER